MVESRRMIYICEWLGNGNSPMSVYIILNKIYKYVGPRKHALRQQGQHAKHNSSKPS